MLWPLLLSLLWAAECTREKRVRRRSAGLLGSEYALYLPELVVVREGESVLVPCDVSYPRSPSSSGPVLGYWFQDGASTSHGTPVATNNKSSKLKVKQNRFELVGDPEHKNCSLLIRDAQRRDTGVYFFRVEAHPVKYNYLKKKLCVCVTALHLQVPGALESSRTVQLNCSLSSDCSQCSTPMFSWTSAALTSPGSTTSVYSVLTLTVQPEDDPTNVTCQVTFSEAGFTMQRTVQLHVPRKSGSLSQVVLVAVGEAAVKGLLLGFCLLFLSLRFCRKKAARPTAHVSYADTIKISDPGFHHVTSSFTTSQ